jgi:hypothetical protein
MTRDRRVAGVGGIAFAVSLVAGFSLFGPNGGHYAVAAISNFVAQSATSFIASVYLFVASIIGLIVLMAHLCQTCFGVDRHDRIAWGASLLAVAAFLLGWGLYLAPSTSVMAGGPAIDPAISHTFISAGFVILFGVGGILLGVALVTVAIGGRAAPMWFRSFSGLTGFFALVSWAFVLATHWSPNQWMPVPFYVVVLWGLVTGVWLLAFAPTADASATVRPEHDRESGPGLREERGPGL